MPRGYNSCYKRGQRPSSRAGRQSPIGEEQLFIFGFVIIDDHGGRSLAAPRLSAVHADGGLHAGDGAPPVFYEVIFIVDRGESQVQFSAFKPP